MNEYECKCSNGIFGYNVVAVIISILIGIVVGILFSLALIPETLIFIIVALVFSVVSLAILLGSLGVANVTRERNAFSKCVCTTGKCILVGSIGTLLASTIALTIGIGTATIASIIFVGLTAFFFIWTIISVFYMVWCAIKRTCNRCCE